MFFDLQKKIIANNDKKFQISDINMYEFLYGKLYIRY